MEIKIVGDIKFKTRTLPVYGDLDAPLFKAADVADLVEYGEGNVWNLVRLCEEDEHMLLPLVVAGQKRQVTFITETGLYNILSQSRKPLARAWRRVVHEELIALRRSQGKNVAEKFDEWDHFPRTKAGAVVGWLFDPKHPELGDPYVDFGMYEIHEGDSFEDYLKSYILDFNVVGDITDDIADHQYI